MAMILSCAVAACLTGASASSAAAKSSAKSPAMFAGTMQEWNWDTAGDNPGAYAVLPETIKAFEAKYPHVTVVNTSMSLEEQTDKLPLAFASASSSPTVSQVNQGFNSMGRLVTDGELLPLNSYAKKYSWLATIGSASYQNDSFTSNGKNLGSGNIYAIPSTADEMGIFYNKKLLSEVGGKTPTSWASFTQDMRLLHQHGKIAMAYGGGQPSDYNPVNVFDLIANQFVPAAKGIAWAYHLGAHPSIDTAGYIAAAKTMQSWAKDGYLSPGYAGLSSATAISQFAAGKAGFLIEGNWESGSVTQLGSTVGFWVPAVTTGGPDEGWAIPTHSPNPALAVAWINEQLVAQIQLDQLEQGNIPLVKLPAAALAKLSPLMREVVNGWMSDSSRNQVVPFLADAPPSSFLNAQFSGVQELRAGQSASSVLSSWQSAYEAYWANGG
jgi:raffinose/stachyose/melibiose transport system substrate-binding protein